MRIRKTFIINTSPKVFIIHIVPRKIILKCIVYINIIIFTINVRKREEQNINENAILLALIFFFLS